VDIRRHEQLDDTASESRHPESRFKFMRGPNGAGSAARDRDERWNQISEARETSPIV
jgi:hypothetical protein